MACIIYRRCFFINIKCGPKNDTCYQLRPTAPFKADMLKFFQPKLAKFFDILNIKVGVKSQTIGRLELKPFMYRKKKPVNIPLELHACGPNKIISIYVFNNDNKPRELFLGLSGIDVY